MRQRYVVGGDLSAFHEAIKDGRIDREAGVIKGVKLMGFDSLNNRRYNMPDPALFEGVKVRLNHYSKENDPDPPDPGFEDIWAFTSNARVTHEGVFADIKYNKAHAMVPTILWWAENKPNVGGFSPITWGEHTQDMNGETVITIRVVESVDLVDQPATTHGFFEEIQTMDPKDVVKLQESLLAKTTESAATLVKLNEAVAERDALKVKLTTAETRANEAESKLAASVAAKTAADIKVARESLLTASKLGDDILTKEFREAVIGASSDALAKTMIDTVAAAAGSPRSVGGDPNTNVKAVESYDEAKKNGIFDYTRSA